MQAENKLDVEIVINEQKAVAHRNRQSFPTNLYIKIGTSMQSKSIHEDTVLELYLFRYPSGHGGFTHTCNELRRQAKKK